MYAAQGGHEQCARALLEAGADKDKQTVAGDTALMLAAQNGHEGCVEALLLGAADPDLRRHDELHALAVRRGLWSSRRLDWISRAESFV